MWIFSRYIISEFLKKFFLIFFILIMLFVGIDLLSRIWDLDAPFSLIGLYYLFKVPNIAIQMMPVSILIATLMLFSYLSKHNELVALYCSGRSLMRIASPMFLAVTLISIGSFYFSDYILPVSNFQAQKIWMVDILHKENSFYGSLHQEKAWFRDKGVIYNIYSYDSSNKSISGMNVYYFDDNFDMTSHIYAKQALYHKKGSWVLRNVKETDFTSGHAIVRMFPEKNIYLREKPDDLKKIEANSDYLDTSKLIKYVKDLENAGLSPSKYKVELNKRYSMSFAGLVMCFIGLPFAVRQHRRGGVGLNIGIGFMLVFIYWIVFSVLLSMGISGRIDAYISAWGANLLFLVASLILIKRSKK
ncbi:MAG: LPS export ABC transporter permease LptG [Proteobacteria bacterium]|nr:LPS export ABC transporter permease LptG [Pseudomonadota bacterium]